MEDGGWRMEEGVYEAWRSGFAGCCQCLVLEVGGVKEFISREGIESRTPGLQNSRTPGTPGTPGLLPKFV